MVAVEVEDRQQVQDELEDEEARGAERERTDERVARGRGHERADGGGEQASERPRERHDDALMPRREVHVGRVHVEAREEVVDREAELAHASPVVADRERVPRLVH